MEAVNGVSEGGPPPPSPLTGCYLLVVIGEPHSQEHRDIILRRVAKGLLSWDLTNCLVDLEKELTVITDQAPDGEEARYGERLIQYASENLVTEILIHPAVSTLSQCVRNLLSSFTRHRHIIHSGYTFASNGSWALQDGTFSLADFSEAFQEIEVQRVIRAYENSISVDIHCSPEGDWPRLPKEPFAKNCKIRLNPVDVLPLGSSSISNFLNYISPFLLPLDIETALESSEVVGNIRFSHPTLYVFPGGQGDAALFGINGFNMLLDGGFSRKACFWDFVRHLDRLDAVLLTRLNNSNVCGISSVLRRKRQNAVYPQIGHFFCNVQERKALLSPDGDKDKDPLLINLLEEGHEVVTNLKHLNLTPQSCYRDSDPINLYHKVGHGTLDMYVLNPARESKEVREFLQKWNNNDGKLFANVKGGKDFTFPLPNLVSICALLVWHPSNPDDNITRILFPGSTPQGKIFEGLDKLRQLDCIKHPICSEKSLMPSSNKKTKDSVIDKIIPAERKIIPEIKKEKTPRISDNKQKSENKSVDSNIKNGTDNGEIESKVIKKSDSTDSDKSTTAKPQAEDKVTKAEDKPKPKIEAKPKIDSKPPTRKPDFNKLDRKPKPSAEKKPSPTTPKKTLDTKLNGESKDIKPKTRFSPSSTPAKSTKEANNRKVFESKNKPPPKKEPSKVPDKKEPKAERKPISRRVKAAPPIQKPSSGSPIKKVQKPDSIAKKAKLEKEGTTDSSTVSTPSADQENKRDISKLTTEEIEQLKAQELADLKEEQEVVQEIEAVFRKGEERESSESELRKIKNISIEEKTDEEYLIVEKEATETESAEKEVKEDETQKHMRDSEESEKQRKLSADLKPEDTPEVAETVIQSEQQAEDTVKEVPITSLDEKIDSDKKPEDDAKDTNEQINALESQPDEKFSATVESGATTAPTLPEDERIPLDEIKEDIVDQIIEEKYVKEETKEKEIPVIQLPTKTFEAIPKIPPVVGIRLDKQSHIRDIVKTPDEVADLPMHEVADHYVEYQQDEMKSPKDQTDKKKPEEKSEDEGKPLSADKQEALSTAASKDSSSDIKQDQKSPEKSEAVIKPEEKEKTIQSKEDIQAVVDEIIEESQENLELITGEQRKSSTGETEPETHVDQSKKMEPKEILEAPADHSSEKDIDEGIEEIGDKEKDDTADESDEQNKENIPPKHAEDDKQKLDSKTDITADDIKRASIGDITKGVIEGEAAHVAEETKESASAKFPEKEVDDEKVSDVSNRSEDLKDSDEGIEDITEKDKEMDDDNESGIELPKGDSKLEPEAPKVDETKPDEQIDSVGKTADGAIQEKDTPSAVEADEMPKKEISDLVEEKETSIPSAVEADEVHKKEISDLVEEKGISTHAAVEADEVPKKETSDSVEEKDISTPGVVEADEVLKKEISDLVEEKDVSTPSAVEAHEVPKKELSDLVEVKDVSTPGAVEADKLHKKEISDLVEEKDISTPGAVEVDEVPKKELSDLVDLKDVSTPSAVKADEKAKKEISDLVEEKDVCDKKELPAETVDVEEIKPIIIEASKDAQNNIEPIKEVIVEKISEVAESVKTTADGLNDIIAKQAHILETQADKISQPSEDSQKTPEDKDKPKHTDDSTTELDESEQINGAIDSVSDIEDGDQVICKLKDVTKVGEAIAADTKRIIDEKVEKIVDEVKLSSEDVNKLDGGIAEIKHVDTSEEQIKDSEISQPVREPFKDEKESDLDALEDATSVKAAEEFDAISEKAQDDKLFKASVTEKAMDAAEQKPDEIEKGADEIKQDTKEIVADAAIEFDATGTCAKVEETIVSTTEKVETKTATFIEKVEEKLEKTITSISTTISDIKSTFDTAKDQIKETTESEVKTVVQNVEDSIEEEKDTVKTKSDEVSQLIESTLDDSKETVAEVQDKLHETIEEAKEIKTVITEKLEDEVQSVKIKSEEVFGDITTSVDSAEIKLTEGIVEKATVLKEDLSAEIKEIEDSLENQIETIVEKTEAAIDVIKSSEQKVLEDVKDIKTDLGKVAEPLLQSVDVESESIAKEMKDISDKVAEAAKEKIDEAIIEKAELADKAKDLLTELAEESEATKDDSKTILEIVESTVTDTVESIATTVSEKSEEILEDAKKAGKAIQDSVTEKVAVELAQISEKLDDKIAISEEIKDLKQLSDIAEKITSVPDEGTELVKTIISGEADDDEKLLTDTVEDIVISKKAESDQIVDDVVKVTEDTKIVTEIIDKVDEVVDAVEVTKTFISENETTKTDDTKDKITDSLKDELDKVVSDLEKTIKDEIHETLDALEPTTPEKSEGDADGILDTSQIQDADISDVAKGTKELQERVDEALKGGNTVEKLTEYLNEKLDALDESIKRIELADSTKLIQKEESQARETPTQDKSEPEVAAKDVTALKDVTRDDQEVEDIFAQEVKDSTINIEIHSVDSPEHAEAITVKDSSPESPVTCKLPGFNDTDFIDKADLGRKSPKEREQDVAKIVASVAEVLKSEAPLEEFKGKIPLEITSFTTYSPYTTELRETHITTLDSPTDIAGTITPIKEEKILEEEEDVDRESKYSQEVKEPSKISELIKNSNELLEATSKMISDIKLARADSSTIPEGDEKSDVGTVHRMLVTASSEDGGEETVICPPGSITFTKSSESSGRSSPDITQKSISKRSISEAGNEILNGDLDKVEETDSNKDQDEVEKSKITCDIKDTEKTVIDSKEASTSAREEEKQLEDKKEFPDEDIFDNKDICEKTQSGRSSPNITSPARLPSGKSTPDLKEVTSRKSSVDVSHKASADVSHAIQPELPKMNGLASGRESPEKMDVSEKMLSEDIPEKKNKLDDDKNVSSGKASPDVKTGNKELTENEERAKLIERHDVKDEDSEHADVVEKHETEELTSKKPQDEIKIDNDVSSGKSSPDIKRKVSDVSDKKQEDTAVDGDKSKSRHSSTSEKAIDELSDIETISPRKSSPDIQTKLDERQESGKATPEIPEKQASSPVQSSPDKTLTKDIPIEHINLETKELDIPLTIEQSVPTKSSEESKTESKLEVEKKSEESTTESSMEVKDKQDESKTESSADVKEKQDESRTESSTDIKVKQDESRTESSSMVEEKHDISKTEPPSKVEKELEESKIDLKVEAQEKHEPETGTKHEIVDKDELSKTDAKLEIVEEEVKSKTESRLDTEQKHDDSKIEQLKAESRLEVEEKHEESKTESSKGVKQEQHASKPESSLVVQEKEEVSKSEPTEMKPTIESRQDVDEKHDESKTEISHEVKEKQDESKPEISEKHITIEKSPTKESPTKVAVETVPHEERIEGKTVTQEVAHEISTKSTVSDVAEIKEEIIKSEIITKDSTASAGLPAEVSSLKSAHVYKELMEETIQSSFTKESEPTLNGDVLHDVYEDLSHSERKDSVDSVKTAELSVKSTDKTTSGLSTPDRKDILSGKSSPDIKDSRKSSVMSIVSDVKEDVDSRKHSITSENTKTSSVLSGKSTPDIREDIISTSRKVSEVSIESQQVVSKDELHETDIKESIESFINAERSTLPVEVAKTAHPTVSIVTSGKLDVAGPSTDISPTKKIEGSDLSGKSTPDIADVEKFIEMQEILKHEKHIPGSSTPPTVPVSPIIKDVTTDSKITKEIDLHSIETQSLILEDDLHKLSAPIDVPNESDDDVPSSPRSVTSQVSHDFDPARKLSAMDQMNTSFYGALPSEEPEIDFKKAIQEHKEVRGESLVKSDVTSSSLDSGSSIRTDDDRAKPDLMTSSFIGVELPSSSEKDEKKDPIGSWGKPLGLPSPAPLNDNKGTPKKDKKLPVNVSAKNKLNDDRKRSESPKKQKKINPVYVDLTYVPHHGNSYYTYVDFFKRVRARYYVFSGIEPSKEVYNALLEAKQVWEDKDLEVTIIPTYDTDVLGYWVAENEELLTKFKIDLSPSASRCTINLQDHETSCSAYRLEF